MASRVREQLAEDETDPTVPRMSANVSATVNATQVTLNCLNPVVKGLVKPFFAACYLFSQCLEVFSSQQLSTKLDP